MFCLVAAALLQETCMGPTSHAGGVSAGKTTQVGGGAAPLTAGWNGQGLLHGRMLRCESTPIQGGRVVPRSALFCTGLLPQNSPECSVCRSKQAVLVFGPATSWAFMVKCWRPPVASRHTHIVCLNCACSEHCVSCAACLIAQRGIGLLPLCRWLRARPPYSIHTGSRLGLSYTHTAPAREVWALSCVAPHIHTA